MYNGIGLRTVRGSATNGYVQRNVSHVSRLIAKHERQNKDFQDLKTKLKKREANPEILEHESKRQMEVRLMELRVTMEDHGYTEEEIDTKVEELRKKILSSNQQHTFNDIRDARGSKSHINAVKKKVENEKLREAFKIPTDREAGECFTEEFAERKRKEKQLAYEERQKRFQEREEQRPSNRSRTQPDEKEEGEISSPGPNWRESTNQAEIGISGRKRQRSPDASLKSKDHKNELEKGPNNYPGFSDDRRSRGNENRRRRRPSASSSSSSRSSSSSSSSTSSSSSSSSSGSDSD